MQTIPDISALRKHFDQAVDGFLKVMLDKYDFNDTERKLCWLPVCMGAIPSQISD